MSDSAGLSTDQTTRVLTSAASDLNRADGKTTSLRQLQEEANKELLAVKNSNNNGNVVAVPQVKTSKSDVSGHYWINYFWRTCIHLKRGGTASVRMESLANWDDPHSGYVNNQKKPLEGFWEAINEEGNLVSVAAKGVFKKPGSSETKPKAFSQVINTNGQKRLKKAACPF